MTATSKLRYVLVTPARNEEQFIELTLRSVVAQTERPVKWVVVSDASTDGTDELVKRYAAECDWIELVRMPEHRDRTFAAKVGAFNAGYERLAGLDYDAVGSLDADISFGEDYFFFLLDKLAEDATLGLVGTPFVEQGRSYDYRFTSIEHVSGACQLFRRECFEAIGGYTPIKGGGIDLVAVISSQMKGWKTRTFPEKTCVHHRTMHGAKHGALMARFKDGQKDYMLGGHPLWEVLRCTYQLSMRPYVIGGMALGMGYIASAIRREKRPISDEIMHFRRNEQLGRLRSKLFRTHWGCVKQGKR